MRPRQRSFGSLAIGDTFDFVDDEKTIYNSFYELCRKTSTRGYRSVEKGVDYKVGSLKARVFHVNQRRQA